MLQEKSSKSSKNLASVKIRKEIFFERRPNIEIPFFYDFKSRFLVIFSNNYRHRVVLEMPFPNHIFSKISKYRTENLHFPSTGKYYAPLHTKKYVEKGKDRIQKKHNKVQASSKTRTRNLNLDLKIKNSLKNGSLQKTRLRGLQRCYFSYFK